MGTKIITKKVRLSYEHLFKAQVPEDGGEPKFSACLLIPKTDTATLGEIKKAVEAAKQEGIPLWGGKLPNGLKLPLRDGDAERQDRPEFRGTMFINATSKRQPGVVEKTRERGITPVINPSDVYSGCYVLASIDIYPFASKGNRGVACGLNHICKVADGEPLGSYSTPEEDFANAEFDDEDPLA